MTPEEAIVTRLENDTAVAAIVSARVYQFLLPQPPTLPAIRVYSIGDPPLQYHLRGPSAISAARVQIDAIVDVTAEADWWSAAWTLAHAVDASISGQVFDDGGSPVSVNILAVLRQTRMPIYQAEERRYFKVMQDYLVWSRTA